MKKYTFKFHLFGKNGIFCCDAYSRKHADDQFDAMIKRNTNMHHVIEEPIEPREPKKPGKSNIDDIFSNFTDIFGKDFPFRG